MQTLAILHDSIRALRSRYLFWISLSISVMVAVALFGMISFNEEGWRVLWFETTKDDFYRADTDASRDLIAWIFNSVYIRWWLSWAAIGLALISTASIVPDFLAGGAIEISLAKPISRLKLISLKVLGAMLFVALQVTVGVSLAWLLMGIKIGIWLPAAFWAIPLITLQFFYLYSVATLVGVLTRSTLASLLITLIFWATCSMSQFSANQIDSNIAQMDTSAAQMDRRIERIRTPAEAEARRLTLIEEHRIKGFEEQRESFTSISDMLRRWRNITGSTEMLLPKTADIQKILADMTEAPVFNELMQRSDLVRQQMQSVGVTDDEDIDAMLASGLAGARAIREVNAKVSILTSLIMPVLAMLAAGLIFLRRDY